MGPQISKDIKKLDQVQQSATKKVRELEHMCYEEKLREMRVFSVERRSLIVALQYPETCHEENIARFFTVVHGGRMKDNEHKLK